MRVGAIKQATKVGVVIGLVALGWIFPTQILEAIIWLLTAFFYFIGDVLSGMVYGLVCILGDTSSCQVLQTLQPRIISGVLVMVGGVVFLVSVSSVRVWLQTKAASREAAERHATGFQRLKRCPKCQSRNSAVQKYEWTSYETTTTEPRITRRYNADGDYIGHEEVDVEVPGFFYRYNFFMKCNACSHTWQMLPPEEYSGELRKECVT